jgi:hypothetical protein
MQTIPVVKMVRRPKKDIKIQETAVPIMNIELRTMLREKELGVDTGLLEELDTLSNERLATQDLPVSVPYERC